MIDLIQPLLVFYFLIIPFLYNIMWQDTLGDGKGKSFLKWYFSKSDSVNWLGFFVFFDFRARLFYLLHINVNSRTTILYYSFTYMLVI